MEGSFLLAVSRRRYRAGALSGRLMESCIMLLAAGAARSNIAAAQAAEARPVQAQMRNVAFHVDSSVVLDIKYLRGELRRNKPDLSPYLDEKESFALAIDTARIGITAAALTDLLNHYTFAYPGSPLRKLRITIENGRLKQEGTMHGFSFTVLGDLSLTTEGELRLHPASIKVAGMKVGGLMKFFGLHLQKLVNTRHARGVRIERDDFLLSPTELLPPPTIEGHLGAVEVTDSQIVQVFTPASGKAAPLLALPRAAANYMFFREGVLRFGKLTMRDTDLLIIDSEPSDAFDFFLDHYNEQLVAGYSRNTADHGLIVMMPDYHAVLQGRRGRRVPVGHR
jgi:hypothetical protein